VASSRILCENPYDLETVFESLSIASRHDKELLYVDRLIAILRLDSQCDLTEVNFKILKDLELIKIKESTKE
jgi:hypothetical protein